MTISPLGRAAKAGFEKCINGRRISRSSIEEIISNQAPVMMAETHYAFTTTPLEVDSRSGLRWHLDQQSGPQHEPTGNSFRSRWR
jgi:hypothetical protein